MQAFAISVILMSGACGRPAATIPCDQHRVLAATAAIDGVARSLPYMATLPIDRYDGGKGECHVAPLSGRGDSALRDRR
jgi:hypothetical protein